MERTLQVLDYAVLVISAADGVQGHVETLWQLLKRYEIPVFLFVNKMDQEGTSRERLLAELKERLHGQCVDFGGMQERQAGAKEAGKAAAGPDNPAALTSELQEELALCDESLLEKYLAGEAIGEEEIRSLIAARKVFPCYFGSALKLWGVEALLNGLARYTKSPAYPEEFGARVYKISRDSQGTRLTHMKITGGSLRVKAVLTNSRKQAGTGGKTAGEEADRTSAGECWEEKAGQIRIYAGAGFQSVEEAPAGSICAVAGLTQTRSGQGLGFEQGAALPLLEPVLTYRIGLPESCDIQGMLGKLGQLEEEEPQLHIVWKEETGEIHAQVMGDVQIEVLRSLIAERFGVEATFGSGRIVYKETITRCAEGIGHFEPLRHYAEAHLWLEPGDHGDRRARAQEAYRGRGFSAGDVPGRAPGAEKGREPAVGAGLWVSSDDPDGMPGAGDGGSAADERKLWAAGDAREPKHTGRPHPGSYAGGLRPPGDGLYRRARAFILFAAGL